MGSKWLASAAAAALMTLGLAPTANAQDSDPPADASTQAVLDAAVEGGIDPADDVDWYRLRVESGQRYTITLDSIPNDAGQNFDPMLGVYDASGEQLAFNDDAGGTLNSALNFVPAASGEVFVEARSYAGSSAGRYRLAFTSRPVPADDAGNDASTRARVTPGRPVNGEIEIEGDVDWYRLNANTNRRYRITLTGAGENGLADPFLRVLDASGAELAINDDDEESLNSALVFTPSRNGDVFIEARAYADFYTGGYTLSVTAERMPTDAHAGSTSTRGRIRIGESLNSELSFPGDRDWFRVQLEEGQAYRFALQSAGDTPLSDPLLRLYDASGTEVGFDDDGGGGLNAYLEYVAPRAGNYFVEARGYLDDATGGYTLSARAGDTPADASTDLSMSADGDYREGVLAPAGDRDWYRVELQEGQNIRISLVSAEWGEPLADPYVVIYGPDGTALARDDDGGEGLNSWLEHEATVTGPHFIEVRGFSEDAAGRYALAITPGEIGASPDGAEYLMPNSGGRMSRIGGPNDSDWFVVELVEGRPYRFNVEGAGTDPLADPMLTLYDSQGVEIAADDDGGRGLNPYLTFAPVMGGPYFAAVSAYGGEGVGRYVINVSDTDVPGTLYTDEVLDSSADERMSRIDIPGDLDNFQIELEAGVSYVIEVRGQGDQPLTDPFLTILNSQNERVTSDDDSGPGLDARIGFTPDASGIYFIQASGLGGSVGWYVVSVARQ